MRTFLILLAQCTEVHTPVDFEPSAKVGNAGGHVEQAREQDAFEQALKFIFR